MPSRPRPRVRVQRVRIRRSYARDLKDRVIHQRNTLSRKTKQIARDLDMPLRVVQRCLKTHKDTGKPYREGVGGAPKILDWELCSFIAAIATERKDTYLMEIKEQIIAVYDIDVSVTTIWRTMQYLGLSKKRLSRIASERDEEERRRYMFEIGQYPAESLVFADESSVNVLTTYRPEGWAPVGERAEMSCDFVRGDRYSMLPAITQDGILYAHVKKGGYNGEEFCAFLEGLMPHMNPYDEANPAPHSVLVIDNCRIHHVEDVERICDERGIQLVYLPPYSPDYNPIELAFSLIKSCIRNDGHRARHILKHGEEHEVEAYLYGVIDEVTRDDAKGFFRHCRYI